MNKKILFLGIVILVFLCAFFTFNNYIYTQKQVHTEVVPYSDTLTGKYICLPSRNKDIPQTMECALGLQTESGELYALDFNQVSQTSTEISTGEILTVSGQITPVEMLSSSHWQRYAIVGILTVTSPVERK
jgi:hypothetical protein